MRAVRYRLHSLLRSGWPAAVAIAVVVAITGGLVLALVAGAVRTLSAPDRYVNSLADVADAEIQQQSGAPRTAELEALPATGQVAMMTFFFGGLFAEGADEPEDTAVFAGASGAVGSRLVEGRQPGGTAEFVASRSFVDATGAQVGSQFQLLTFTRAQAAEAGFDAGTPEGPSFEATLVGVIDSPAELTEDLAIAVFPPSLLDGDIGAAASVGSVGLEPGFDLADLRTQVADLPEPDLFTVEPAEIIDDEVRNAVSAQGRGLAILAAIAAVTTMVVLGQLLSRQYRLAESERAVLRSLGYTRRQVIAEPVIRAAVVVTAGMVAAAAFAYLFSGEFPRGFVERVEPDPGRLLAPVVHLVGPVLLLLALLAWMTVSLALGDREVAPVRSTSFIERLVPAIPSASAAIGLHFAFAGGTGRTRSTRVPLLGLILMSALLIGALTFGHNLTLAIDEPARYGINFDLALGQGGDVTTEDVQPLVDDPDLARDIEGVTIYGAFPVDAGSSVLYVIGMQPVKGRVQPEVLSGRLPASPDEIALGRISARKLDVSVGDTVTLTPATGRQELRVTGTVQPPSVGGAGLLGDAGVVTVEAFRRLAPDAPMDTAAIDLAPGAPADAARRITAATGMGAGQLDPPSAVTNINRIRSIPFLIAAVLGALVMLSLGHQLLVAVRRRRRDLAVLKALGTSRRGLSGVIHVQATLVTAAVLLLAVPLGIAAGVTVYRPYVDRIGARTDIVIPTAWVLLAAVALLVTANLIAAVPAARARRASPSHTLART